MNLLLHQLLINSPAAAAAPLSDDDNHDGDDEGYDDKMSVKFWSICPNPLSHYDSLNSKQILDMSDDILKDRHVCYALALHGKIKLT